MDRSPDPLGQSYDETGPAPGAPGHAVVDRQRTKVVGLGEASRLAIDLLGVTVEPGDLFDVHAVACQPLRDVEIAQALDIGEYLGGAGSGGRAGGRKRIAGENQPR